jgi:hypothetical protein
MSGVYREFWSLTPMSDSCNLCQDMAGNYHEEPERPHENCRCYIAEWSAPVEEQDRHTEIVDRYELLEPIACRIPRGGGSSVSVTWSTGTTKGMSGGGSYGGVSLGGSVSQTTGTAVGESVTFNYDKNEGGDYQLAFVVYEVTVYQETVNWLVKWSEVFDDVPDEPFTTVDRWDERVFVGYRQVGF